MMSRLDLILDSIYSAYKPPDAPDFHWVEPAYEALKRDRFVLDSLSRSHFIKVVSDLNIDVSLRIQVQLEKSSLELALSCIRPWAMLWRFRESDVDKMIVEEGALDVTTQELALLERLKAYGFVPLTREELRVPVNIVLFDTEPDETRVFHVLFSDFGAPIPFLQ